MKQRKGKFWSGIVVVLVAAGITASVAQGRVAKGIEFRTFATPQQYGEIRSESLSKLQSGQTLGALAVRSEGMNRLYGQTQSGPNAVVSTSDSGFSWSDAGIGAGVAFGSAMLVGAAAVSRRRQTHVAV